MAVSVQCPHCKAKLSMKSESALGKKVACPKCKKPFQATATEEDPMAFLDEMEPEDDSPAEDDEEAEAEEPERRSRSGGGKKAKPARRRSTNVMPFILGGIGVLVVLVLIGGVGVLVWQMLNSRRGMDWSWIPSDSKMVAHLKVAEFRESAFSKSVLDASVVNLFDKALVDATGTHYADISTITLGGNGAAGIMPALNGPGLAGGIGAVAPAGGSIVIRSVVPFNQATIRSTLKLTEAQHGGKSYARSEGVKRGAIYFPDPTTLVLAEEETLQSLLAIDGKTNFQPDLGLIDQSAQFFLLTTDMTAGTGPTPLASDPTVAAKVRAVGIDIKARADLTMSMRWQCTDAEGAKAMRDAYEKQLNQSRQTMKLLAAFNPVIAAFDEVMASTKLSTSGNTGSAVSTVPASIRDKIQSAVASLSAPGQGMGLPFGGASSQMPGVTPGTNDVQFDPSQLPAGFPAGDASQLPPGGQPQPTSNAPM